MYSLITYFKNNKSIESIKKTSHFNFQTPGLPLVLTWEATGRFGTKWHEMGVFGNEIRFLSRAPCRQTGTS